MATPPDPQTGLPPLRVEVLGALRVTLGGRPVELPPARRARSLLAYLAVHAGQATPRDALCAVFWPDAPEGEARRHLSQALWRLRGALGDSGRAWIAAGGDTVGLATPGPLWTDLAAFEAAAQEAEVSADPAPAEAAARLYRGELLAGWPDEWLLPHRERAHGMYLRVLERLVEVRAARGEYAPALEHARALTRADPWHEPGHREVMRLLVLLGRPAEARREYEHLRGRLRSELGAEPAPETERLAAQLAGGPGPGGAQPPLLGGEDRVPLVGRADEGAALREAVTSPGGAALLGGEPGIGKTRLLRGALEGARWHGLEAVLARPPGGAATPYGTLRALFAGVAPHVLRAAAGDLAEVWRRDAGLVVPELGSGGPPVPLGAAGSRERLREALARAVLALGRVTPLVALLDDLHAADEDSLDVLRRLAARGGEADLRLVLAYRDEEARARPAVWSALEAWARAGARRLTPGPLDEAESALLVRRGLGLPRPDPALETALYRAAGGHPQLLRETVRALFEAGEVRPDGAGGWTMAPGRLAGAAPAALDAVVGERFARLGGAEQTLAHLAAVLGGPFTLDVLLRAAPLDTPAVLTATASLVRLGWWGHEGGQYRFVHDHLRQAADARVPSQDRPRLHARVGEALEAEGGAGPGELARHFGEAGEFARAAAYHRRAAEAAAALHAYGEAARHDRAWLTLAGEAAPPGEGFAVLLRLEETSGVLGDTAAREEAMAALHARAGGDPARELEVALRSSQLLRETGRLAEAASAAREALEWAERRGEPTGRARALLALGRAMLDRGGYREAVGPLQEAARLFGEAGDETGAGQAQCALSVAWSELGERAATLAELEAALALFRHSGDVRWEADVLSWLASEHMERGNFPVAERTFDTALRLSQRVGYRRGEAMALLNWATLWKVQGHRRARTADHYRRATAIFDDLGERRAASHAGAAAAGTLIALGDFEEGRGRAETALTYFRTVGDATNEAYCLAELANIPREEGDFGAARATLNAALARVRESGGRYMEAQVLLSLAELALEDGSAAGPGEALAHLDAAAMLSRDHALQSLDPDTLALRGRALLALGDVPAALEAAENAVRAHGGDDAPPFWVFFTRFQARAAAGDPGAHLDLDRAHAALLDSLADLTPGEARRSLTRVAAHRRVVEAWEARHLRREQVALPAAGVPGGRSPRGGEWVSVTWTAAGPDDLAGGPARARRQHRLRRLLAEAQGQGAVPGVRDLAALLGVSVATVKRDLADLRAAGERPRTRRGRT